MNCNHTRELAIAFAKWLRKVDTLEFGLTDEDMFNYFIQEVYGK